jgi:sortase A
MFRSKKHIVIKACFLLLLFVLGVSGYVVSFFMAPTAYAAVETQTPTIGRLPVAQTIPTKRKALMKIVQKKLVVVPKTVQKTSEARLIIPSIKVDAVIKDMGVTSGGAMAVPNNRQDVGWYSSGTRPGELGSAVIGGHNRWDSTDAVFDHLNQLAVGDLLSVRDAKGVSTHFVVSGMQTFDATDENSGIFASKSGIHLNLITCSGTWDPITKSYTKRLVIFTNAYQDAIKS